MSKWRIFSIISVLKLTCDAFTNDDLPLLVPLDLPLLELPSLLDLPLLADGIEPLLADEVDTDAVDVDCSRRSSKSMWSEKYVG